MGVHVTGEDSGVNWGHQKFLPRLGEGGPGRKTEKAAGAPEAPCGSGRGGGEGERVPGERLRRLRVRLRQIPLNPVISRTLLGPCSPAGQVSK